MESFDEYVKNYKFGHCNETEYSIALYEFITKKYDIMSYFDHIYLKPGDTVLFMRDFISDIKINEPVYFVVDKIEYLITDKTRIFPFLSALKPIILRNKTNDIQSIRFKRWFVKMNIIDSLRTNVIHEGDHYYFYGEIHNDL